MQRSTTMSYEDEEDPKKPRPVRDGHRRRTTSLETEDPWQHLRKDNDRDHHRHVSV